MTRLITEWIQDMENTTAVWSRQLEERTGMDFISLAAAVSEKTPGEISEMTEKITIAVVPVTSGLGVIGSFAQSVAAILSQMGFFAFVTESADVAGIYEAKVRAADIVFTADDNRYIAFSLNKKGFAENDYATARGYVLLLDAMARKMHGCGIGRKNVLLLGYGRLGRNIETELLAKNAAVTIYDNDPAKKKEMDVARIKEFHYIVDATCSEGWLTPELLSSEAMISAPGIPSSLDERASAIYEKVSIHDNLEIGTISMLGLVLEGRDV